jgi:hypothetical protein
LKVSVTNCLATLFPLVAAEWHPTKNGNLTPDKIVAKSHSKVWWLCPKAADHEWQATVNNRTNGRGCPHCVGKKVSVTNSLAVLFPGIATEWHPTKNGRLTPDKVVAGSHEKFWWRCAQGTDHEWQATLANRTHKTSATGCPFCRGLQVSITNSLAALFPDIAAEWHSTKNGSLTPEQVVAGSIQSRMKPSRRKRLWRIRTLRCGGSVRRARTMSGKQHPASVLRKEVERAAHTVLVTRFLSPTLLWHSSLKLLLNGIRRKMTG